jgi:hypothetical protein
VPLSRHTPADGIEDAWVLGGENREPRGDRARRVVKTYSDGAGVREPITDVPTLRGCGQPERASAGQPFEIVRAGPNGAPLCSRRGDT